MFIPVINMYEKYVETKNTFNIEQERKSDLLSQKTSLIENIEYLRSDIGREAELRSRFGKGKEGEKVTFIMENEVSDKEPKEEDPEGWDRFKGWFLGLFK